MLGNVQSANGQTHPTDKASACMALVGSQYEGSDVRFQELVASCSS